MTGKKFLAYVERCLAPTLKRKDIVMIDNLPAHMRVRANLPIRRRRRGIVRSAALRR
jgi:hypothetical protein